MPDKQVEASPGQQLNSSTGFRLYHSLCPTPCDSSNSHYEADPVSAFCVSGMLPRLFAARKPLPHANFPKVRIAVATLLVLQSGLIGVKFQTSSVCHGCFATRTMRWPMEMCVSVLKLQHFNTSQHAIDQPVGEFFDDD
jgi:hypothetical protein